MLDAKQGMNLRLAYLVKQPQYCTGKPLVSQVYIFKLHFIDELNLSSQTIKFDYQDQPREGVELYDPKRRPLPQPVNIF